MERRPRDQRDQSDRRSPLSASAQRVMRLGDTWHTRAVLRPQLRIHRRKTGRRSVEHGDSPGHGDRANGLGRRPMARSLMALPSKCPDASSSPILSPTRLCRVHPPCPGATAGCAPMSGRQRSRTARPGSLDPRDRALAWNTERDVSEPVSVKVSDSNRPPERIPLIAHVVLEARFRLIEHTRRVLTPRLRRLDIQPGCAAIHDHGPACVLVTADRAVRHAAHKISEPVAIDIARGQGRTEFRVCLGFSRHLGQGL